MSYRLPRPLPPEADESLAGLVVRSSQVFRFRDPRRIMSRISPPKDVLSTLCDTDPGGPFGQRLQGLLGLDEGAFRSLSTWSADEDTASVLGHPVWRELVRRGLRAVCPLCLKQSGHHRAVWFLDMLPVCADHGVWLFDRCPRCARPLDWTGGALGRCGVRKCACDLAAAPVRHVDAAHMPGIVALHRLLHADAPEAPLGMPVGEVFKLVFMLGRIGIGMDGKARPSQFVQLHRDRLPELVNAGWSALSDWPNGFAALLTSVKHGVSGRRQGKSGVQRAFGRLSKLVYEWSRQPWGEPIGRAFAEFVAVQPDLAPTARTLALYAPGTAVRSAYVTLTEAAKQLDISQAAMRRVAENRGLFVMAPRGMGLPTTISVEDFVRMRDDAADFLLPEQARALLGVGMKVMLQLEQAGLVRRVPEAERVMESKPFRKSEVTAFVNACIGKAPSMTKATADARKLSTVTGASSGGRTTALICAALAEGRVKAQGAVRDARGLMRVRLDCRALDAVLPVEKATMSVVDAARDIGVPYEFVHVWIRRGLLTAVRRPGVVLERGQRITEADWEQFKLTYVTGGELARMARQKGSTWVSRYLRHLGVEPVSGPGVDESKVVLFRRTDCTPELFKRIRAVRSGGDDAGTPQERHQDSFRRVARVASLIEREWGARFTREHNRFFDQDGNRTLQVVSGRRPDLTGVFVFRGRTDTLAALAVAPEPWVALVPNVGNRFLMMPANQVPWRVCGAQSYVSIPFNAACEPQGFQEFSRTLLGAVEDTGALSALNPAYRHGKAPTTPRRPFDLVGQVAAAVGRKWGVILEGRRNTFVVPSTGRTLQVIVGRPTDGPKMQVFNIRAETLESLAARRHVWVAFVPSNSRTFLLMLLKCVEWRGKHGAARHLTVPFSPQGKPLRLQEWAEDIEP